MTTQQIRIRLTTDEMGELKKLAKEFDLNVSALVTVLVKSALRAVVENDGRLALPLRFKVDAPKCGTVTVRSKEKNERY